MAKKRREDDPCNTEPLSDGDQTLLDFAELREQQRLLLKAFAEEDSARETIEALRRQLRAAEAELKRARMRRKLVVFGQLKRLDRAAKVASNGV